VKAWLRKIWLIAGAGAVLALLVYAFWPQPVDADLAAVTRGRLRVTVDEDGRTRIKERYDVSSPLAGRLLRINLDPGDPVSANDTNLAVIEPTDPTLLDARSRAEAEARVKAADAGQKRAQANLKRDNQALDLAKRDLARARQLVVGRSISVEAMEDIEHKERMAAEDVRASQFAVQIADFELEQAQAALLRTRPRSSGEEESWRFTIRSPISGKVLRTYQESATIVTPGTKLLQLGDATDLEVEIDVLSQDGVKVQPGARVFFEHWGGAEPLEGRVRLVEPAAFTKISALGVEEQRVWVIVDLVTPPEERPTLGDAYRVEARIVVWEGDDVLKVPAGALFRHADGWAVYRDVDGKARLTAVTVGHTNGLETQILDGLKEGDQVVVHPSDMIRDGVALAAR
jgi:HlyD family secretion protein